MLLKTDANFRRYWSAAAISNLGDGIAALAFPWVASLFTRDPFLIALVASATRLPWLLFSLAAGVITDRVDRRLLIFRADLARVLIVLAVIGIISVSPALPLLDGDQNANWLIMLLTLTAFAYGTSEVFRDNAAQTALPQIVAKKDLEEANSQLWSIEQIMGQFVGPPLAGFLIAISTPWPFVVDVFAFALAAYLIWTVRMKPIDLAPKSTSALAQLKEGFVWVKGHRTIFTLALMLACLNFVIFGSLSILVLFGQEVLGLSASGYGFFLSVGAAGAILGAQVGPYVARKLKSKGTIIFALILISPCSLFLALSNGAIIASIMFGTMWAGGMIWNIITVSYRQRVIPGELLGRVNSIYRFFGWGAIPLGSLAAGLLVNWAEPEMGRETALRLPFIAASIVAAVLIFVALAVLTFEPEKKDPA